MSEVLVKAKINLCKTCILVKAAVICKMLTEKVVKQLLLSIL